MSPAKSAVNGLRSNMKDQKNVCNCACNDLLRDLLQAMTAQSKQLEAQNLVMGKIVDQNSDLMLQLQTEESDLEEVKYKSCDE